VAHVCLDFCACFDYCRNRRVLVGPQTAAIGVRASYLVVVLQFDLHGASIYRQDLDRRNAMFSIFNPR
jgi:hypothetical protein